jgi:tetrahydromethanopterin S-methyltransferase subunit G
MNKIGPSVRKYFHPIGMPLGILFGIVLSAALQWIRDGGVAQGAVIGLVLGLAVFGPVFSQWMNPKTTNTP